MSIGFGTVYALCDPGDGRVRYVGKTAGDPLGRRQGHIRAAQRGATPRVSNWIRSLDQKPVLKVLETGLPLDQLNDRERYWIKQFSNLTNHMSGGDGWSAGDPGAAEAGRKGGEALRGIPKSEAHRKKISEAVSKPRRPLSAATKKKISEARKGKPCNHKPECKCVFCADPAYGARVRWGSA